MFLPNVRVLIATFWVGTLWSVGFIVAPTLFSTLADRALAGTIAGSLFRVVGWLSIFSGAALLALLLQAARRETPKPGKWLFLIVAAMLVCTAIGVFGIQPQIASLREVIHAGGVVAEEARKQFGMMHGISTAIFAVQSLLGVVLILKIR